MYKFKDFYVGNCEKTKFHNRSTRTFPVIIFKSTLRTYLSNDGIEPKTLNNKLLLYDSTSRYIITI